MPVAAQPGTAVAQIEGQRAVAEALAAMRVARAFPRDQQKAIDQILNDCSLLELAEEATYDYARGGSDITGASIRLLETICRRWGNMRCGVQELERRAGDGDGPGESDVRTYAIDLETGFSDEKVFTVRHWRDTKRGGYKVTDERDIYEVVANYAARRKRACMEAIIPADVKEKAIKQCEVTLKAKVEITPDFINSMLETFAKYGVTQEMIEKRMQRKITAMSPGHAINLKKIANSLKEQMSQPQDWFDMTPSAQPEQRTGSRTENLADELATRKRPAEQTEKPAEPKAEAPKTADPGTGEITNATLRAAIEKAGAQADLTPIMMDILKLPDDAERRKTSELWTAKCQALKDGPPQPKPQKAKAKPHGTKKEKDELTAKMNKAKTMDQLNDAANEITLYAWDEADRQDLEKRYAQCKEDLSL